MRKNRNSSLSLLLSLALLAALAGCSKKEEAPPPPPPQAKPQAAPVAKPPGTPAQAVQKQLSSARPQTADLDFRRRTDPFKPPAAAVAPAQAKSGETPAPVPAADLLPIQSFDVTKFKVAGIIAGLTQNRALVMDPNGKGYVVQAGMPIGNKNGRISRITANSVEVSEAFRDEKGKARKRTIVLTLAKKK